jgi:hypothetical protein
LNDVEKEMFHRVAWTCEFILYLLAGHKCNLGEVVKRMIQRL